MWSVQISEQTATFAFYSINWLVFYNPVWKCLLRGTYYLYETDYVSIFLTLDGGLSHRCPCRGLIQCLCVKMVNFKVTND